MQPLHNGIILKSCIIVKGVIPDSIPRWGHCHSWCTVGVQFIDGGDCFNCYLGINIWRSTFSFHDLMYARTVGGVSVHIISNFSAPAAVMWLHISCDCTSTSHTETGFNSLFEVFVCERRIECGSEQSCGTTLHCCIRCTTCTVSCSMQWYWIFCYFLPHSLYPLHSPFSIPSTSLLSSSHPTLCCHSGLYPPFSPLLPCPALFLPPCLPSLFRYLQHMQLVHRDHFGDVGHPAADMGGGIAHPVTADVNTSWPVLTKYKFFLCVGLPCTRVFPLGCHCEKWFSSCNLWHCHLHRFISLLSPCNLVNVC